MGDETGVCTKNANDKSNTGLSLVSAIYGGDKRDKAQQGAEGSLGPYRGIPCLQAGVTQNL